MKKYLIVIEADTNDGDYVEKSSYISEKEVESIIPIIRELKLDGNYTTQDQGNTGEEKYGEFEGFKLFDRLVPSPEYGIHTIESIRLIKVLDEEILL